MIAPSPYQFLRVDQAGKVTIVKFTAPAILDEGVIRIIEDELLRLEKLGNHQLLLNFREVKYLSSTFLATLVKLHRNVAAVRGRLVLCAIDPDIAKVFQVTHLDRLLTIYRNHEEAIQSFGRCQD